MLREGSHLYSLKRNPSLVLLLFSLFTAEMGMRVAPGLLTAQGKAQTHHSFWK